MKKSLENSTTKILDNTPMTPSTNADDHGDNPRHITLLLQDLTAHMDVKKTLSLGDIIDFLHERGFGILIFLFALPMAIPLPVPPGINLIFATPLLFLTFQLIYGAKKPWLPQKIRNKTVEKESFDKVLKQANPWLGRLSYFIRPRMGYVTQGVASNLVGLFGFVFSLCISIPIPMTNTVPSMAVLLMAVGLLMRDGFAIIFGMILGTVWLGMLATIGVTGLKALIHWII